MSLARFDLNTKWLEAQYFDAKRNADSYYSLEIDSATKIQQQVRKFLQRRLMYKKKFEYLYCVPRNSI